MTETFQRSRSTDQDYSGSGAPHHGAHQGRASGAGERYAQQQQQQRQGPQQNHEEQQQRLHLMSQKLAQLEQLNEERMNQIMSLHSEVQSLRRESYSLKLQVEKQLHSKFPDAFPDPIVASHRPEGAKQDAAPRDQNERKQ
jgi:molecular chaperone GrpE (heat shock protein)